MKINLTEKQKKLDTDNWIIALVTGGIFMVYALMGNQFMKYITDNNQPIILRLLLSAVIQFGIAGLGISIVCLLRKERFSLFGLTKQNTVKSILGAVISFIPYLCTSFVTKILKGR